METLQARLDSFTKGSKRAKGSLAKSTSTTWKWPHPPTFKATPNTLAEAGFWFNPGRHARDNVRCFICGKELAEWEPDDDPFEIHWEKCGRSCAWAIVRCGLKEDVDEGGRCASFSSSFLGLSSHHLDQVMSSQTLRVPLPVGQWTKPVWRPLPIMTGVGPMTM